MRANFLDLVRESDRVFLNAVVVGELLSGFDRGGFRDQNRRELREFIFHPAVSVVPMTEETAERYSVIFCSLRNGGTPIPTNDLWIASSVMESGAILITSDKHFEKVKQIQIEFL